MQLISGFVDTYLRLTAEEQTQFQVELRAAAPEEQEVVMQIVTSWMEEGLEQGRQQGLAQGSRRHYLLSCASSTAVWIRSRRIWRSV